MAAAQGWRRSKSACGCWAAGKGKVNSWPRSSPGVVLAEKLLAAAISSSDWVSSHEKYGRNR